MKELLNHIDKLGPLLAIIAFCFRLGKLTPELKLIFTFCIVQFLCNLSADVIATKLFYNNNYWIYKINTLVSFAVILVLFCRYLLPVKPKMILPVVLMYIACSFLPMLLGDGITTFNSYSAALTSFIVVCCCLYYFYIKLIRSTPEESVPSTPVFWMVIGIFTYYAGSFFIFISYKLLIEQNIGSIGTLWRFHNILLFICCMYISYGVLWKNYRKISLSY